MSGKILLQTEGLSRHFGGLKAVSDVSLRLEEGRLHAIIGPNGAGKSTLFGLLSGAHRPASGAIRFDGRDITRLSLAERARLGIARSYQITTIFKELPVLENVRIAAQSSLAYTFYRAAESYKEVIDRAREALDQVGLAAKADHKAAHLSHGEQRHLDIAIALATRPRLLLLDEPTAGMSPVETDETIGLIRELSQRLTVVLVEHKMQLVMSISQQITVLHFGQILAEGTPAEIQANPAVQEAYLGGEEEAEC